MRVAASLAVALAVLAAALAPVSLGGVVGGECLRGVYVAHSDGSVEANLTVEPSEAPGNVTIRLSTGTPLAVTALDPDGVPLPVSVEGGVVVVTVYSQEPFTLYYAALDLTSKENATWTLRVADGCAETVVALPEGAVPYSVDPEDFTVTYVGGLLALSFKSGEVEVKYILPPQPPPTSQPASPAPAATASPTSPTGEGGGGGGPALALLAAAAAAGAAALLAVAAWRRRSSSSGPEPSLAAGLDDRDRAILDALRSGPKTAAEIAAETGIPKTPLYRRLRRLAEWGLIESYQEGGVRRYRLRGEGSGG